MRYLMLAVLVACSAPKPKPVVDSELYGDICKPVTPHYVPRKIGGYHLATKELNRAGRRGRTSPCPALVADLIAAQDFPSVEGMPDRQVLDAREQRMGLLRLVENEIERRGDRAAEKAMEDGYDAYTGDMRMRDQMAEARKLK